MNPPVPHDAIWLFTRFWWLIFPLFWMGFAMMGPQFAVSKLTAL